MSQGSSARVSAAAQYGFSSKGLLGLLLLAAVALCAWWWLQPEAMPGVVRDNLPIKSQPIAPNPLLYKWKDDQDRWNITDRPPEGRKYQTIQVDPNTNLLPAGVPPEPD